MNSKNSADVMKAMEKFINDAHPKILESDQDSAYLSNNMLSYLKNHDIIYSTVADNDHHVLGIINRFIRTIRDMSSISSEGLSDLIDAYNNSSHRALPDKISPTGITSEGLSPNEMTSERESKYIDVKKEETNTILGNRVVYPKGLKVRI
jgi:hypothetical protein